MAELAAFSLARRLRAGETLHSGWCGLGSPIIAELVARAGFPAVTLDAQHGLWDLAGLEAAIAGVRMAGAAPMVRVALGDFPTASRLIDFGAEGIIAPMINSAADARAFVAAAKYPPLGERSWGPHRALTLAGIADPKDYLAQANDSTIALAMIETRAALDNVEAIAATPGIDGLFLGPTDLAIALSAGSAMDARAPEVDRALDRIIAAAANAGKIAGTYCPNAADAAPIAQRGARFFLIGSDTAFVRGGAVAALKMLRS